MVWRGALRSESPVLCPWRADWWELREGEQAWELRLGSSLVRSRFMLAHPSRILLFGSSSLALLALAACGNSSGDGATMPGGPLPDDASGGAPPGTGGSAADGSGGELATGGTGVGNEVGFELHSLSTGHVGVAVSAASEEFSIFTSDSAAQRQDLVTTHFNQLTAGNIMKMSYLHPSEDTYTFTDADQLVNFAADNGLTVHGHALVWHSDYQVPSFMNGFSGDWSAMLTTHVQTIIEHFPETVVSWDVVNEAVDHETADGWRHSLFYEAFAAPAEGEIPEYIEVAFQAARDADADVELYYNDYDNTANTDRRDKTLQIAEKLNEQSLIDGVGFQMHVYMDYPSLSQFETAFQQVVDLGLKVKLTELDIPIINPYSSSAQPDSFGPEEAEAQRRRYCAVVTTYLETVPEAQRAGVSIWGLTDDDSWLMEQFEQATGNQYEDVWPLLFNADFTAKPALQGVADAFQGNPCSP